MTKVEDDAITIAQVFSSNQGCSQHNPNLAVLNFQHQGNISIMNFHFAGYVRHSRHKIVLHIGKHRSLYLTSTFLPPYFSLRCNIGVELAITRPHDFQISSIHRGHVCAPASNPVLNMQNLHPFSRLNLHMLL